MNLFAIQIQTTAWSEEVHTKALQNPNMPSWVRPKFQSTNDATPPDSKLV